MPELERLCAGDFEPLLHDPFQLTVDNLVLDLELVEVNDSVQMSATQARAPFTLLFKGDPRQVLPSRMYRIDHRTLGGMDLFISPVRADQDGCYYEAVFG